jgi:two-component system, OmpR family, osmolarity sensor histidine kinase EnvZ
MQAKLLRIFIPQSLLGRIAWVLFIALALSQALAAWLFYTYVTVPRVEGAIGVFVTNLKTISSALETLPVDQHSTFLGRMSERDGIRVLRKFDGAQPTFEPKGPGMIRLRERLKELLGPTTEIYLRQPNGGNVFVKLNAQGQDYWIGYPRKRVEPESLIYWAGVGAAVVLLALIGSYFIVRRLNQPLRDLASASRTLAAGQPAPRVEERGPAEVVTVTREFNRMSDALVRQERERASFLAGVSHDLRTPLARLRLGIEMLPSAVDADARTGMVSDVEDMRQVIDQFLDFARDESGESLSRVDLVSLLGSLLDNYRRSPHEGKIKLNLNCLVANGASLQGRPVALRRLFANLIDNAAKYGGGVIDVQVDQAQNAELRVSIQDRGAGLSESDVERLKQPFVRGVDARSGADGAGLGLAIAERIVRMHGGRLDLAAREGGGLNATVTLPA